MSKGSNKKNQPKWLSVFLIFVTALLVLDGLAYAAWRIRLRMPAEEPAPEPTATYEPTPSPEPTSEPLPSYSGGYFYCEDGLFYPDRVLTRGELSDALSRASGKAVTLSGDASEELNAETFRAALAEIFGEDAAVSAEGPTVLRGGESVTRAEAAVVLNALLEPEPAIVSGVFPDVEPGYWASDAVSLAAVSGRNWPVGGSLPEQGFVFVDGWLYCADENGYFLKNSWLGSLYFTSSGRYTSGSYELDEYVAAAIAANTEPFMPREEMLRAMYVYVRDSFSYLRRHYYRLGDVGWALEEATTMYATGKGNCYCYAGAFWAAARALGYDAKIVSGTYGKEKAPHGWVEIFEEDGRLTYDVEIEMKLLLEGKTNVNLYAMDEVARRGHGYIEIAASDDLAPRETNEGLLPG